ncbi:hypothetical protein OROGR_021010 [Orobanche gracilis]
MSASFTPPPPPVLIDEGSITSIGVYDTSSGNTSASSSSIIVAIIIIASAIIVSASVYFLLRYLSRRFRRSMSTAGADVILRHNASSNHHQQQQPKLHVAFNDLINSLPLFTFRSVTPNIADGDCAVCLSKFKPHDQLRLLPLCCHAFHAACIDAWIVSNQTCPLCRSTVLPSGADALHKILSSENRGKNSNGRSREGSRNGNGGSFLIEIGSISSNRAGEADTDASVGARRSYSVGSFDYIVDGNGYEVPVGCTTHSGRFSDFNLDDKEESWVGIPIPPESPGEVLSAEFSGGRNWLRECVYRLASVSNSSRTVRSSGRFFSGSSRHSEGIVAPEDLDAYRTGEEISEIFRWLSGV